MSRATMQNQALSENSSWRIVRWPSKAVAWSPFSRFDGLGRPSYESLNKV